MIGILLFLPFSTLKSYKVGLALSGGVARGIAHIGVLKVLEANGIYPDMIAGTSMGSIVGGLYSCGYSAEELEDIVKKIDWSAIFSDRLPERYLSLEERRKNYLYPLKFRHNYFNFNIPQSIVGGENILLTLEKLTSEASWDCDFNFDSLPIPFRAVAADVETGDKIVIKKGRLSKALRASSSIPGVFDPVEMEGRYLIDGGVVDNLPVSVLKEEGCDFIIAVDVGLHTPKMGFSAVEIIMQGVLALSKKTREMSRKQADVFIAPYLKDFSIVDFYDADKMIKQGEIAALSKIEEIKRTLGTGASKPVKKNYRKKMIVASVKIEGLKNTRNWIVKRVIKTKPGDTLSPLKIYNDLVSLYRTDIFRKVDYEIKKLKGTGVELRYKVEERPAGILGFGVYYYYPDELTVLMGLHQGNIMGLGINIEADVNIGWNSSRKFSIGSHNLLGLPVGFETFIKSRYSIRDVYSSHVWNYSFKEYFNSMGAVVGFTPSRGEITIGYITSRYSYIFPSYISEIPESPQKLDYITLKFEYVNLDKLFLPSYGFAFSLVGNLMMDSSFYSLKFPELSGSVKLNMRNTISLRRFYWDNHIIFYSIAPLNRDYLFCENMRLGGELGYYRDEIVSPYITYINTGPRIKILKIFSSPIFLYGKAGVFITDTKRLLTELNSEGITYPGVETGVEFNSPIGVVKIGVGTPSGKDYIFYLKVGTIEES